MLAASPQHRDMLSEWLAAAGFDVVAKDARERGGRIVATLLRWPCEVDLATLPRPIILLYEQGAQLQAAVGRVSEVVELPDSADVRSLLAWSANMSNVLRQLAVAPAGEFQVSNLPGVNAPVGNAPVAAPPLANVSATTNSAAAELIAVGISTGGPASLRVFFAGLAGNRDLPPIVIVQHIPPAFVADLVARLRMQTGYDVQFCADHQKLQRGAAYIAPGDHHVRVVKRGGELRAVWDDRPPIRGHCPSVEVLYQSCCEFQAHGIAVMMTGMGRDGSDHMLQLRQKGWATIGQNEASCTIYGMPSAAKAAGAIERELSLEQIAPWLVAYCRRQAART